MQSIQNTQQAIQSHNFKKQKNITESDTFFDFQYHLEKFTILIYSLQ